MPTIRHANLFRNGRNQTVQIPREMELPGKEVLIHREGYRLIIEPVVTPRGPVGGRELAEPMNLAQIN